MYSNMAKDFNIVGEEESPNTTTAEILNEKIRELKKLNNDMKKGPIEPLSKTGSVKFWVSLNKIKKKSLPTESMHISVKKAPLSLRRLI